MHLTQNKNFATLFERSPLAIDAGHAALKTLKDTHSCRAILFQRKVVGHEASGWVIVMCDMVNKIKGFLVA